VLILSSGGDRPRWWRYPIAAGLFVLAHWVYAGVSVWLLPLVVSLAVLRPGVPITSTRDAVVRVVRFFPGWVSLVLISAAFGLGIWFMHLARHVNPELTQNTPQDSLPKEEWIASWLGFFDSLNQLPKIILWPEIAGGLAIIGLLTGLISACFRRSWPPFPLLAATIVIGIAGASEFLFIGTRMWPAENLRQPRYIIGFLESSQVILGLAAVFPVAGWVAGRGRWIAFATSGLALFVAATIAYGFPSAHNPRADLDAEIGRLTPDILTADVDAIGGDYWTVWPAVLHANMNSPPRAHPFIGITMRSSVFRTYWEQTYRENMRVAVKDTEKDRNEFLRSTVIYGLSKPVRVGSHGELAIYTTHPIIYTD
jgi:hypothetical protein